MLLTCLVLLSVTRMTALCTFRPVIVLVTFVQLYRNIIFVKY